ncbi:hypothetical protein C8R45DRAFT_1111378 [Mycena sanguinolenta]|nr:hypothetical protein C8R45DRAFT_1111378 [Mycena sanguinolenta]
MNPPAAIKITTTTVMRPCSTFEDNESITSNETIRVCTGIASGTESSNDVKPPATFLSALFAQFLQPLFVTGAELQSYLGCGEVNDEDNEISITPTIHVHAPDDATDTTSTTYKGSVHDTTSTPTIRNSDTTCLDVDTRLATYDPCLQHLLFPSPALKERIIDNHCLPPFWCNVTPERPQPLTPASSLVTVTDRPHMSVTVIELPWGGFSFTTTADFDQYVEEDDVFQLKGKLLGWWRMVQFKWERGGWAFVFIQDESRHVQGQIAIPRNLVRMKGPVPRIQREADLIADRRLAHRQKMRAEQEARPTPPPPPPTPVGAARFSTPLIWEGDVEGMFVMDDE